MDEFLYHVICIAISLFLLIGYAFSSYLLLVKFPYSTHIQTAKTGYSALLWLKKHSERTDSPNTTVAVQTVRNSIYVAMFIGGSTFVAASTLLNSFPHVHDPYQKIRIVVLSLILFLSFLSWASVLRCISHLGYMTGVLMYHEPQEQEEDVEMPLIPVTPHTPQASPGDLNSPFRNITLELEKISYNQEQQRVYHERSLMYTVLISFRLVTDRYLSTSYLYVYINDPHIRVYMY